MLGADIGDQTWNLSAGMNHASTPSPHIPPQDIFRKQNTGIHFDGRHIQGQFLKLFGELGFGISSLPHGLMNLSLGSWQQV